MPKRPWYIGVAFVLILGGTAVSQQSPESTLESEPKSQIGQTTSSAKDKEKPAPEQKQSLDPSPALKGIEAAIRDLKADIDQVEYKRQKEREIADLEAQKDMALWTERMTQATWATVLITAIALGLLWKTMRSTKVAADAAKGMLVQARKTTVAAEKSLKITREIGIKQTRANIAYLDYQVKSMAHTSFGCDTGVRVVFKNFGNSPAREVCFHMMSETELNYSTVQDKRGNVAAPKFRDFDATKVKGQTRLFCGPRSKVKSHFINFNKKEIIERRTRRPRNFIYIAGWIRYKDDFWQSADDYRFCKFCIIVDSIVPPNNLLNGPPSKGTIDLREHGQDNYSD